jgi:integrase
VIRATWYGPAEASSIERHATAGEYQAFLRTLLHAEHYKRQLLHQRTVFVAAYPTIKLWRLAPLAERIGLRPEKPTKPDANNPSVRARMYLVFLCVESFMRADWEWVLATRKFEIGPFLRNAGVDLQIHELLAIASRLGYQGPNFQQEQSLRWILYRIVLTSSVRRAMDIRDEHLEQAVDAVWNFGKRPDVSDFFGSPEHYRSRVHSFTSAITLLHNLLYHAGSVSRPPRPHLWPKQRQVVKPGMEVVLGRYLQERRIVGEAKTVHMLEYAVRQLIRWVAVEYPAVDSFAQVTREHVLEFARALDSAHGQRTHRLLATHTKIGILAGLATFFRDVAYWGWDDVPGYPPISNGDLPRRPNRIPRFIPDDELGRLMQAVECLDDPFKRAAILVARWTGARREEIQRLPLDCLDRYPDGTARLHIPVGKTHTDRMVPMHEDAAEAVRIVQRLHRGGRGLPDRKTHLETQYLFTRRGKLLGWQYLFQDTLREACEAAGLVGPDGGALITAHRFRHTVGTKMAERGARLTSIMAMLGHRSPHMAMTYIAISDEEVRRDYQKVLQPGATIAGPLADTLRAGALSSSTVAWVKANFFKTSLELGHCLRLPEEGPCECDLYLTCAKFITTPEYAPRLRRRRKLESELAEDAAGRGWTREIERHRSTAQRIDQLLCEMHEPLDGAVAAR